MKNKISRVKNTKFDDEICQCGHSKGYHSAHSLDKHGGNCEKCKCIEFTWGKFVVYKEMK